MTQIRFTIGLLIICFGGLVIIGIYTKDYSGLIGAIIGSLICVFVLTPIFKRLKP
jgi:uncharacterized membrane protein